MTDLADFGPLVLDTDLNAGALRTIKFWLPRYLTQYESTNSMTIGTYARPSEPSYATVFEDDGFPDQKLPAIIVTAIQSEGEPDIEANAFYSADFQLVVTAMVKGKTRDHARNLAGLYGGLIRLLMVQQPTLDGTASATKWRRGGVSRYRDTTAESRELAAGVNVFTVSVDDIMHADDGPVWNGPLPDPDPDPDIPYDPLAIVSEVDVTIVGHTPTYEGS
jgi:hypothetical protein